MYVYRNRITIYEKKLSLDEDNFWVEKVEKWKDVWADVSVKTSGREVTYEFVVKFFRNFPRNFNVALNGTLFNVKRLPIVDPGGNWIKFFGKVVKRGV